MKKEKIEFPRLFVAKRRIIRLKQKRFWDTQVDTIRIDNKEKLADKLPHIVIGNLLIVFAKRGTSILVKYTRVTYGCKLTVPASEWPDNKAKEENA